MQDSEVRPADGAQRVWRSLHQRFPSLTASSGQKQEQDKLTVASPKRQVYYELPNDTAHIRLLQLQPGDRYSPLKCSLAVYGLAKAPKYCAISYVWGDSTCESPIEINGIPCEVGSNCNYALWQLRDLGLAKYYWIDALCINQDDLDEKGRQVRFMAQIFKTAQRVLSCVDRHSNDSCYLFRRLLTFPSDHDGNIYRRNLAEWLSSQICEELLSFCNASVNFSRRPYFSRLWIVQEVAVARDIELICGPDVIDWRRLSL